MDTNTPGPPDTPDQNEDAGAAPGTPSKIRHTHPTFGTGARPSSLDPEPVQMVDASGPVSAPKKITAFGKEKRHEEDWNRTPNTTGTGAIHVKTFHSKLTADALANLDRLVNEWLDAHPQYEVKFVATTVGTLSGKLKEPNLICQVWV